jgi:MOSC domain-containing protein YiiM
VSDVKHLSMAELQAGLERILQSPKDHGVLEMIVRRPAVDQREMLQSGRLDPAGGLEGDTWSVRGSTRSADGSAHPDMQLNVMNARAIALVAQEKHRWPLAGDQLFIDLDLSDSNLPAGTRLSLGTAVIEITAQPHLGCKKFTARFGHDAMQFVNSELGKQLHLRGVNAKVVKAGVVRIGDQAVKL